MLGPKRGGGIGSWQNLPVGELHNSYFSPNIIRAIKLRRIRLMGHITCMREKENACRVC